MGGDLTGLERDRSRGALLGLAVGDALGTTHEFKKLTAPPFPTLATGPLTDVVGGGPFRVEPGQVTDDTQMACALADSIVAGNGYDAAMAARHYLAWKNAAFDIGGQIAASLALLARGAPLDEAARAVWDAADDRRPAGNGALMRTAPIAVLVDGEDPRRRAALADAGLTHADPRCVVACAAFDAAIAAAVDGADAGRMHAVATAEVNAAADVLLAARPVDAAAIADARTALASDLDAARSKDPDLYGRELHLHSMQGFVRVAFRLAFWELHHAPSFEAALVDVVNRGGDADTNGAITGALLGALYGERAIPGRWTKTVLGALANDSGPLGTEYHPRVLLHALESKGIR